MIRYDNHFPMGEKRDQMVGLNDFYATICDLLGLAPPYLSAQDSISFANYITSDDNKDGLRQELATFDFQDNVLRVSFSSYLKLQN